MDSRIPILSPRPPSLLRTRISKRAISYMSQLQMEEVTVILRLRTNPAQ